MDVWYVSYGSNLLEERFLCYIYGQTPEGSTKPERGCHDQSTPKGTDRIDLPYPLYFSKEQSKWGAGGVAFIDHRSMANEITIGRKYLITEQQFIEVVAQENNIHRLQIDLQSIMEQAFANILTGWYGRIVYLGTSNGRPLFTFTNPNPMKEEAIHTPARPYLRTIAKGLLQLGLSKEQTVAYLLPKKGINGNFSISSLYTCLFGK
ncbi:hypothetical protein J32TS6_30400 [Virgibacillus pantothenticus]|uniref:hypothetical protein n=1 Tax=Virgibacillus TaxID=84406 RepID=UPI000909E795|nr:MULTISPECIES: hypothetical protein [Virgibacillus]API91610.1 hypothetical protein BKP57_07000 [Virgibacillus sp. 6R]MBS7426868.1 hypothetical protein [Virgibacillus sp. 19R1-5]MBU8568315.1 hypothetical protein [Virgibacillus pantothenticus]MBU8602220.1 hypothetical protein [Virgibacillus pantothenticus]MBU8636452.1 hypothetical protein [Virgibacillus pantothenticus]